MAAEKDSVVNYGTLFASTFRTLRWGELRGTIFRGKNWVEELNGYTEFKFPEQ